MEFPELEQKMFYEKRKEQIFYGKGSLKKQNLMTIMNSQKENPPHSPLNPEFRKIQTPKEEYRLKDRNILFKMGV